MEGKVCGVSWHGDRILHLFIKLENNIEIPIGSFTKITYKNVTRPYSICNLGPSDILEFVIALKEGGEMSEKLKGIKLGEKLEISKPVQITKLKTKKILFITGGTGIAAFISIIRAYERGLLDLDEVVIFHSVRNLASSVFFKELTSFKKTKVFLTFTREEVAGYLHGRINREVIEKNINPEDYEIHVCGPKRFVEGMEEQLKGYKIEDERW